MGWIRDGLPGHEGWVANVLADGRTAAAVTGGGVIVHELTAQDVAAGRQVRRYPGSDYVDVVIGWDQVVSWRVRCECGWTGGQRPAVTDAEYGSRHCPESVQDEWAVPQWDAHVAPFAALVDLEDLVEQLRTVESRIADTVRLARGAGMSWSQIGAAAGLSKQGAQQRWG